MSIAKLQKPLVILGSLMIILIVWAAVTVPFIQAAMENRLADEFRLMSKAPDSLVFFCLWQTLMVASASTITLYCLAQIHKLHRP